jgi:hypothetical protein
VLRPEQDPLFPAGQTRTTSSSPMSNWSTSGA